MTRISLSFHQLSNFVVLFFGIFLSNVVITPHTFLFNLNVLVTRASEEATPDDQEKTEPKKPEQQQGYDYDNLEWGTFYDPKEIFCGDFDCYKILGLDYYDYVGKNFTEDNLKHLTKKYRTLSRRWHPDKNKRKDAEDRFVKIKRAYEVLNNYEMREEYDYFRDRPDAYFHKYGSSVLWKYAPKSNTALVIVSLLLLVNLLTYTAQKQRWKTVADHLVKAAVEDWSVREGGSDDSAELRKRALEILAEQEKQAEAETPVDSNMKNGGTKPVKRKSSKDQKKEKKQQTKEELRKIVSELVYEIEDFGAGFHQPTYKDLFFYKIAMLPYYIFHSIVWRFKYIVRRLRRLPYSDEELEVFTKQMVGNIAWEAATDEEREEWKGMKLWVMANYEEWVEDQEVKKLGAGVQKRHAKWKKKNRMKSM